MEEEGILFEHGRLYEGRLIRFRNRFDRATHKNNAWYILRDEIFSFGDWKMDIKKTISTQDGNNYLSNHKPRALTVVLSELLNKEMSSYNTATAEHPYAIKKNIFPYKAKVKENMLCIPIYDNQHYMISIQYIDADGKKRFKANHTVSEGTLTLEGEEGNSAVLLCEGYATGCSLRKVTGCTVIICFSANNLRTVISNRSFNTSCTLICADNDEIGLTAARKSSDFTGINYIIPPEGKDFNDFLFNPDGLRIKALARLILKALVVKNG